MKFTIDWLEEYLETDASLAEICKKLNEIGLEVEDVVDNASGFAGFNCVLIEECEKHPDSDHLKVCKVRTGEGDLFQVVCGAPNARKGLKGILARIGVSMPEGGFEISKSKIRGIESCGMMCSEKELGIGSKHEEGIIEVPENTELGKNVADIYNINDIMIDLSLTPNRADSLGIYGIARDLSATGIGKLKEFKQPKIKEKIKANRDVKMNDENCSEFAFRYIKGVKNRESPQWLRKRLEAVGINPKTALVDITNYVMLTLNRPLHCYDADKVNGNFVIRKSKAGEKFLALDKNEYTLSGGNIIISDEKSKILCLGGIIGSEDSATQSDTTNILLECAIFDSITIAKTARELNINTDSKYRFERDIDKSNTDLALDFAAQLILDICGGECSEEVKQNYDKPFVNTTIDFNLAIIPLILGFDIPRTKVLEILKNLGYRITEKDLNILHLTIPAWRNTVTIPENVVEDIIRIYGYDNLPSAKISSEKVEDQQKEVKATAIKLDEARALLTSNGLMEIISWGFMKKETAAEFMTLNPKLKLVNPISSEMAYMRPTIIPNMLNILKNNQDRGIKNIALFEIGKTFVGVEPNEQKNMIAGIRSGLTAEKDTHGTSRLFDVFDVKKDILDILELFNISKNGLTFSNDVPDYYHPNRSTAIKLGSIYLGCFGEIHPLKVDSFGIKNKVNAFELFLNNIPKQKKPKVTQKKKFTPNDLPIVNRDFAFILNNEIAVGDIVSAIKKISPELIKEVNVFDIYQKNDEKSVAFSVKIQPIAKTLTSEEIDIIANNIIDKVQDKFKGILRNT